MDDLYEKVLILENKLRLKDKKIAELLDENNELKEDNGLLKDMLKRTVCQSECYKHKLADKYKKALEEIQNIHEQRETDSTQLRRVMEVVREVL